MYIYIYIYYIYFIFNYLLDYLLINGYDILMYCVYLDYFKCYTNSSIIHVIINKYSFQTRARILNTYNRAPVVTIHSYNIYFWPARPFPCRRRAFLWTRLSTASTSCGASANSWTSISTNPAPRSVSRPTLRPSVPYPTAAGTIRSEYWRPPVDCH